MQKNPNAKIIHDPRLTWNSIDIVGKKGGSAIMLKTGHAFIKERIRIEDAVYGGEMSAHHYFKDLTYCDRGMIPWLLISELLCVKGKTLSDVVAAGIKAYPSSGEINTVLKDPQRAINRVVKVFESDAKSIDHTDGINMEFDKWRFNLRRSNTEAVVRLNVESDADLRLMQKQTEKIIRLLNE